LVIVRLAEREWLDRTVTVASSDPTQPPTTRRITPMPHPTKIPRCKVTTTVDGKHARCQRPADHRDHGQPHLFRHWVNSEDGSFANLRVHQWTELIEDPEPVAYALHRLFPTCPFMFDGKNRRCLSTQLHYHDAFGRYTKGLPLHIRETMR
jgi:hypothetical protein